MNLRMVRAWIIGVVVAGAVWACFYLGGVNLSERTPALGVAVAFSLLVGGFIGALLSLEDF